MFKFLVIRLFTTFFPNGVLYIVIGVFPIRKLLKQYRSTCQFVRDSLTMTLLSLKSESSDYLGLYIPYLVVVNYSTKVNMETKR